MKTKTIFISVSVFLYASFYISTAHAKIIISEVQITGATGHSNDDFVELYNPGSSSIDISNYRLRYKNSSATSPIQSLREIPADTCIASNGYYLWANSNGIFADIADTKTGTGLSSNYSLALFVPQSVGETIVDSVSWGSGSHPIDSTAFVFANNPGANQSMVRNLITGDWLASFSTTPTPTKSVSTTCPTTPPPIPPPAEVPSTKTIRLSEIFPNPKAKSDTGEFIELYNFGTASTDISGWVLRDATKTGKYTFPSNTIIAETAYLAVTDQAFKLSLNNSNETISLFDNADTLIDSVHYEKTKEDVSLNYTSNGWRGGTPTPGAVNSLNNLPETKEKVPKKGYHGVAINFDARGKDSDHDTLKYTWDFGDNHKSYKEKTTHTYEESGTYTVILKTSDGKDDTEETFTIKIESFPRPEVRITSLIPNPAGSDTDNEWIMIENREKKTVNLKGFGIATGWKKLVNHPIREDFFIGPKAEAKLTRQFSLFTLPNQKGKIELRAPDGKVLQKMKYKLEKSIAENVVYQKKKGQKWQFVENTIKDIPLSQVSAEANKINEIAPPENSNEETPPPAPTEDTLKEEESGIVLPAPISLDPNRPEPQDLLAYGTRIRLPAAITLMPPATEETATPPDEQSIPFSLAERLASNINASLNELLNNPQEE